jgi:alpha-beta hydrolase superfamily lysophospholipase
VLSSPALDAGLSAFQKLLLATLPRVAPHLTVGNGLDPHFISRNPAVVAAYQADPRVHDRISTRLARFIAEAGPSVIAHAPEWSVPTLLMYAGGDRLVDPAGSRAFADSAPAAVVSTVCFDQHYHEIFNEPESAPVFDALRLWLDRHFAAP